jgi:hypothetical protein
VSSTTVGRWAARFFGVSVILFALLIVAYNTDALPVLGQRTVGGLALWVVTAISVIGTLIAGAVSLLGFKDRSAVTIVATVYGILATALLAMGAIPEN